MPVHASPRLTEELLNRLGGSTMEGEILAETASSLGHHGRQVERAMAALRAFDADTGTAEARAELVDRAALEVWKFFIQRELCGLRDQRDAIRVYGIPNEVLYRMGAVGR